MAKPK
ncbi:hypothetical protein D043_1810, partial [Vibrio parahaemolyticus EKP-021]